MGRRAIGIVRVSRVGGREGESFASPGEQRERIRAACERDDLAVVEIIDELDVSGGTALERRAGLLRAVEAVEAGEADVIVAAYFDRLIRSLRVQGELVGRVEAAGGQVLALDTGQVTGASAGQWLSGTMLGAVAEYQRRTTAERAGDAQVRAVARGVVPWPRIPPGYRRRADRVLEPDSSAPVIAQAFAMRADGAPVAEVRAFLTKHGIRRSYHGVTSLLKSRVYLGEIHFGKLVNLTAHEPIVDRGIWQQVQRARATRGRRAASERLLARLGILRCESCDARMVVASSNNGRYVSYRCPPTGDCRARANIGAEIVEGIVVEQVRAALAGVKGRASAEQNVRGAVAAVERAQADLAAAIRAFAGLEDERAARDRLVELRDVRDAAQAHLDQLGGASAAVELSAAEDWDRLPLERRRALIRATVERVVVGPGRDVDRVLVELVTE